jgi:hypothetical protein
VGLAVTLFLLSTAAPAAPALPGTSVVPLGFETEQDDGWAGTINQPIKVQNLYSAELFPSSPLRITGIGFRPESSSPTGEIPSADVTIRLSTSPKTADALSDDYESNHGEDVQIAFSGVRAFDEGLTAGEFSAWFSFDTPFLYDPTKGSLLVEVVTRASNGVGYVDSSNNSDDAASRAFGYSPDGANAEHLDTGADILALGYEIRPTLVVPSGFEDVEDDGFSHTLGVLLRLQEVYGAANFPDLPMQLTGVTFRRDASAAPFDNGIALLTVRLSTTPVQPDNLSLTFAANYGGEVVTVHDGPIEIASPTESEPGRPAPFEMEVPFDMPFSYDPAEGNLLVEVVVNAAAGIGMGDQSNDPDDHASRVFTYSPNASEAAYRDSGADVLRLDYATTDTLLRISPAGGWREGPGLVTISTWPTAGEVRYTLDGSEPTSESALYQYPLTLENSTILRAALFSGEDLVSEVIGETYLIRDQPVVLRGYERVGETQVTLRLDAWEGFSFDVVSTADFRRWTYDGSAVNVGGRVTFEDPRTNRVARFYQLELIEP